MHELWYMTPEERSWWINRIHEEDKKDEERQRRGTK
jgi:hypothetical protein